MKPLKRVRPSMGLLFGFGVLVALSGCGSSDDAAETSQERSYSRAAEAAPRSSELPETRGPASSATVFREHRILDPGLNEMVATTLLVPDGWKVEGGIIRPAPQYSTTTETIS